MPKRSSRPDDDRVEAHDVSVKVSGPAEVDLMVNGAKVRLAVKRPRKPRVRKAENSVALDMTDDSPLPNRHLFRDKKNALGPFGGVCAGLSRVIGIDPFWLRIGFISMFFLTGVGVLAYLILWVLLPDRSTLKAEKRKRKALPPKDEVPPELVEAWREVNEITKN